VKRQNREKMINKIKKRVHSGAKIYGSWTVIFEKNYHNYLVHVFGVIPTPKVC